MCHETKIHKMKSQEIILGVVVALVGVVIASFLLPPKQPKNPTLEDTRKSSVSKRNENKVDSVPAIKESVPDTMIHLTQKQLDEKLATVAEKTAEAMIKKTEEKEKKEAEKRKKEAEKRKREIDKSKKAITKQGQTSSEVLIAEEYEVKPNEVLGKIAKDHGVTIEDIMKLNKEKLTNPNKLPEGTILIIRLVPKNK